MPEKDEGRVSKKQVAVVLALLIIAWVGITGGIHYVWNKDDAGTIGDSFGAVNALFSALALGAIVYTLWQQQQDLRLQRKELQLQREELSRATEAHQERNAFERHTVQLRLSLELSQEWSSPEMRETRDRACDYLRTLTKHMISNPFSNHAYRSSQAEKDVVNILHFFDKTYLLVIRQHAAPDLLQALLFESARAWSLRWRRDFVLEEEENQSIRLSVEHLQLLGTCERWDELCEVASAP